MTIVYINCSVSPFIDLILAGKKVYETRNKNTLKRLISKTVYLAETGKGKAIVKGVCTITDLVAVTDKATYNRYRKQTQVKHGSIYDFTGNVKYLYKLDNVKAVNPFPVPENAVKHGRIYATV